ncbi:hypothetical protein CPC08DRAFT_756716 [Agrocybe pediades]|nr:hypothetical protein CPC08DRAFT_756716 [Agrocybe pediades]
MSSSSLGASPEATFTPRREFIREDTSSTNAFALLAISSANCIRLYSFTAQTIDTLRHFLEQTSLILSFRQDAAENLWEFALDGKPWANPKSVSTEKLLVDLIALIYQCGYSYLSTIDYGREADDRLAMAFSRPIAFPVNSGGLSPLPTTFEPIPSSPGRLGRVKRVPFALSFTSVTVMRVISPPLHLTPAILQAVRASWPRGVVSERKVGDNCYEFKLKGYKWFQQDTFATDSLRHILSLLSSLDAHSFSLLASISLTNRSRVKDLWVFTGPAPEGSPLLDVVDESLGQVRSLSPTAALFSKASFGSATQAQHRRLATEPALATPSTPTYQHPRASTESASNGKAQHGLVPPQVLRKPAPRAQVPVSVVQDPETEGAEEAFPVRTYMPSVVSDNVENMTGIGTRTNIFYETPPTDVEHFTRSPLPMSSLDAAESEQKPFEYDEPVLRPVSERAKTPPLLSSSSSSPSPPKDLGSAVDPRAGLEETLEEDETSPRLLGIGTFRDSAFSSNSELSCEVPIKWTGPLREELKQAQEVHRMKPSRNPSNGPQFPGGWQPTPIMEKAEEDYPPAASPEEPEKKVTPIHELTSRFDAPEVIRPDMPLRKSEAALVGIIQSTSTSSPPPLPESNSKGPQTPGGQGWVLVNVDNSGGNDLTQGQNIAHPERQPIQHGEPEAAPSHSNTPQPEQASSAAKAIVVIDALDSKHKKNKSVSSPKQSEGGSGVRRFFSLNRKNSKKAINDEDKTRSSDKSAPHSIPRSNLRDRLRLIGTPEASRREDKRRSID